MPRLFLSAWTRLARFEAVRFKGTVSSPAARLRRTLASHRAKRPPRGLSPGKGTLFLGTVASADSWQPPNPRGAGGYPARSGSPVLRAVVWALILATPIVGYLNKDVILKTAHHTMNKYLGPTAMETLIALVVKSPQHTDAAPPPVPRAAQILAVAPAPFAPPSFAPQTSAMTPSVLSGQTAPMPGMATPAARTAAIPPAVQAHGTPMPSVQTPTARANGTEVVALRANDGHFYINAVTNGARVPMMFDTGATDVALRPEDAARMGIDVDGLNYSGRASTANGVSRYAPVVIESLTVGDITVRNVPASVHRPGALSMNLLGQSFMTRLAGYNVEGNKLNLHGR